MNAVLRKPVAKSIIGVGSRSVYGSQTIGGIVGIGIHAIVQQAMH